MTVLLAVAAVGTGSLAFRLVPLLGARRVPDRVTVAARWAGLSVLVAMTVRSVVDHRDPQVPAAPLVAAVAVAVGLLVAFRGRSVLLVVLSGISTYVALAAALAVVG